MSETVEFSEAAGLSGSPGQIVARIGICSLGEPGVVYEYAGGQQGSVAGTIGYGPLGATTQRALQHGRNSAFAVPAEVALAGSISAITKTGDGPVITVAEIAEDLPQIEGPWFSFPDLRLKVVAAGALGAARMALYYDGVTEHEIFDLPPQYPAFITGTVDLNTITLATLNTLTVDLSDVDGANPAAVTLTTPTSVADLITQIDAIVGATASLVGGRFLRISGATPGATSGSITNGNGTANTLLGLTNGQTADGIDSTYQPPGVGIEFTFPADTYVLDTTYDLSTVGPRMDLAGAITAVDSAAAALRASGFKHAILHIVHEPYDGLDLASWQAALNALTLGWRTAEDNPIFVEWVIGGPLWELGTGNDATAIAATDQDVKTNLLGTQEDSKFHVIGHGDIYLNWVEYSGVHRAQLATPTVERMARYPLNVKPGFGKNGPLEQCYLEGIDGTRARTEALATVKMQDSGFTVLRDDGATPYVRNGRTRAPSTSQFTGIHTARAALECARVLREIAFGYNDDTPALGPTGQLSPVDKANIEGDFQRGLNTQIVQPNYASSARAVITGIQSVGGTDKLFVKGIFQRLANIEGSNITVFVTNDVTIVEGISEE